MGRKRIIPESDIPLIKQWLKEGRKYADIATHYNLKSWKTVSRFVQEVMQINKFTDISEPELIQILRNELQVDEKQTKGFSLLKPALAREFDSMYIHVMKLKPHHYQ